MSWDAPAGTTRSRFRLRRTARSVPLLSFIRVTFPNTGARKVPSGGRAATSRLRSCGGRLRSALGEAGGVAFGALDDFEVRLGVEDGGLDQE